MFGNSKDSRLSVLLNIVESTKGLFYEAYCSDSMREIDESEGEIPETSSDRTMKR